MVKNMQANNCETEKIFLVVQWVSCWHDDKYGRGSFLLNKTCVVLSLALIPSGPTLFYYRHNNGRRFPRNYNNILDLDNNLVTFSSYSITKYKFL